MKSEKDIRETISDLMYELPKRQNYDEYKYFEGVLIGLRWVLNDISSEICPACGSQMIEGGMPPDDSGHVRLLCLKCGKWKWKDE